MIHSDPISGFETDDYEPQRPITPASTDELAARQTARAAERLRSGKVLDREAALVRDRARWVQAQLEQAGRACGRPEADRP
jgi:hypothetical protein